MKQTLREKIYYVLETEGDYQKGVTDILKAVRDALPNKKEGFDNEKEEWIGEYVLGYNNAIDDVNEKLV